MLAWLPTLSLIYFLSSEALAEKPLQLFISKRKNVLILLSKVTYSGFKAGFVDHNASRWLRLQWESFEVETNILYPFSLTN